VISTLTHHHHAPRGSTVSQVLKSRAAPAQPQAAAGALRPQAEDSGAEEPRFTEINEDEDADETESKKDQ
jgi:hypothetical protein